MTDKQSEKLGRAALNAFVKYFKSKGAKPNTKELAAASKPAVLKVIGVAMGTAELMKMADTAISKIPVIGDLLAKLYSKEIGLYDKTFGQTPVLKEIYNAHREINKSVWPNMNKYVNDPKYYEHTDMHQAFQIPFNFPDTELLDFASGINTASIAIVNMGINPNTDTFARQARQTQIMDLLKGVRGLSGRQPYSVGDLDMYQRHCEYVVNEYCRLKFALRVSQLYIMTKTRMPRNVLSALGWDPEDFIKNRASYVDALTTLGNFITNNLPMYGVQIERIQGLWKQFIPDSNDGKIALLYKVNLHTCAFIPFGSNVDQYGDFFFKTAFSPLPVTRYELNMRTSNVKYDSYMSALLDYTQALLACEYFTSLRADIIGAFGKSAIWTDSRINEVADYKFDDLIHAFDELFLTQLQNGTILWKKSLNVITAGTTTIDAWTDDHHTYINERIDQTDGSFVRPLSSDSSDTNHVLVEISSSNENREADLGALYSPASDGFAGGALSTNGNFDYRLYTDSTPVLANKYNMKESEQVEILQMMSFAVKGSAQLAEGKVIEHQFYVTNTMFLNDIQIIYADHGSDKIALVQSYVEHALGTPAAYDDAVNNAMVAQFWSQADYMPKLAVALIHPRTHKVVNAIHWDFNIMGSISKKAFLQAVRLAAYSVASPNVKLTEIKKINNIVDVYSIK